MKIAFVTCNNWMRWGGSEELWSRAALALRARGCEVLACVAKWDKPVPQIEALERAGCRIRFQALPKRTPLQRIVHAAKGFPRQTVYDVVLRDALKPFAPDLVVISQGHNLDGEIWAGVCRQHNLRYALIAQAVVPLFWPDDERFESIRDAYVGAAEAYFVSRHNRDFTEREIATALPRAQVIWNPFVVPFDQPPPWPDPAGEFRLAQVARLDPGAKGQDLLFEVLAQDKWRQRPLRVSLVGGGNCARSLRALAQFHLLTNVDFAGHVSDVAGVWKTHHALILPSRQEGLPLALIEACLCERTAIVTDAGGNAELVVDGETGFVATDPSVAALDRAMERAWQARAGWRELGIAARRHARSLVPRDPPAVLADRLVALCQ
jgi:glycosyltransferase involved in cell wall biosynthesis